MGNLFDTVIIGAGVVGLAAAKALAEENRRVVVLEKNRSFGQETSSRNSEVIHAGIYYRKDFLKSRLCLEGNRMLYEWCAQKGIPHQRIGKLIVATNDEECADLERIRATATDNGVEGLTLLGKAQARAMEPNVAAMAAIFSPNTGIIDSHRLMQSYLTAAEEKEAIITYRAEVTAILFDGNHYELTVNDGEYRIAAKHVINSAGLQSDRMAALAGIDIAGRGYALKPCKGNYFSASPAPRINHLVYPVPVKNNVGLGIHATIDLAGRVRFGPDSHYLAEGEAFDYAVDETLREAFYNSIRTYLPDIAFDALHPDMSGIRPKIQGPGDPAMDFIIREESEIGLPGLVNLIGIESPGLTSSMALGKYITTLLPV